MHHISVGSNEIVVVGRFKDYRCGGWFRAGVGNFKIEGFFYGAVEFFVDVGVVGRFVFGDTGCDIEELPVNVSGSAGRFNVVKANIEFDLRDD